MNTQLAINRISIFVLILLSDIVAAQNCSDQYVLAQYEARTMSTMRVSNLFEHHIRVTVTCGSDVDVDDVFERIEATERLFESLLALAIRRRDGASAVLEIVVGGCSGSDCAMEIICADRVGVQCDLQLGQAYHLIDDHAVVHEPVRSEQHDALALPRQILRNEAERQLSANIRRIRDQTTRNWNRSKAIVQSIEAAKRSGTRGREKHERHTVAFVPVSPPGQFEWVPHDPYVNLQHEFVHLLDFVYFRSDFRREADIGWWVEGLPQYIQWRVLGESTSWERGNDWATLEEIFGGDSRSISHYYDGLRAIAFLEKHAPNTLIQLATDIREGVYRDRDSHRWWQQLLSIVAAQNEDAYRQFLAE